jgi:hypothetical protein
MLSRAIDVAIVGDYGAVALADRTPVLADMSGGLHRINFAGAAHFVRTLHERVAPLMRVLEQAAAIDPGLEELRLRLTREMRADTALWIA